MNSFNIPSYNKASKMAKLSYYLDRGFHVSILGGILLPLLGVRVYSSRGQYA